MELNAKCVALEKKYFLLHYQRISLQEYWTKCLNTSCSFVFLEIEIYLK